MFKGLAERARRSSRRPISQTSFRRRRAILESLEDRRVLANFAVVTAGDPVFGSCTVSACSLRAAIAAANAAAGADTISFAAGVTGTITLSPSMGSLDVTNPLVINGPGSGVLTINANASTFRVFNMGASAGNVTISGLRITGGREASDAGGGIRYQGTGTLSIQNSVVTGNSANNAGGIYVENGGTLSITGSTISNNDATYFKGGGISNLAGNTTITSSTVTGNTSYADGAGIYAGLDGTVTVTNSTISNNEILGINYLGGGIYSGNGGVTITGSTLTGNTSTGVGGAIYSKGGPVSITGNSSLTFNVAAFSGGALYKDTGSLTVTDSVIDDNTATDEDGGGIKSLGGTVTITRSSLQRNIASGVGGGLFNSGGAVNIRDSVIAGNNADLSGGGLSSSLGPVTLTNSTITNNVSQAEGGGVFVSGAALSVLSSTIVQNFANVSGGGIGFNNAAGETAVTRNSIIANNLAAVADDLESPVGGVTNLSVFFSLIGSNDGNGLPASAVASASGNLIGTDASPINPMLGPLQNNSGTRASRLPLTGSPAIDSGSANLVPNVDQRGFPRPAFIEVDMGAVEFGSSNNAPPTALNLPVTSINENIDTSTGNVLVGNLSVTDASTTDTHTYVLATGTGSTDNGAFVIIGNQLFVKQNQVIDFETKQNYSIRVRVTDSTNLTFTRVFTFTVNNLPEVTSIRINNGLATRSQLTTLTVSFDTIVNPTLLDNAFVVTNITTGTQVGTVNVAKNTSSGSTVATLTFAGNSTIARVGTGDRGNSLADGNYRLDILASNVAASIGGATLARNIKFGDQLRAANPNDNFFRLFGDASGNGIRNNPDLLLIIPALSSPAGYRADLDFEGNGFINNSDLLQLIPTLNGAPRP